MDMLRSSNSVFLALSVIEFMLGMLGNGFIGLVNGSSWFKSRRISLADFITTLLALSRIILLWFLLVDNALMVLTPVVNNEKIIMQTLGTFWIFTNDLNIWLVTCLSVLYCLKIASFSHPMFLWLKWRVSRVVVWMLLGSVLLSFASAMCRIQEFKYYPLFSRISDTRNMTEHCRKKNEYKLMHGMRNLWHLPPLIVSLASNLLLILSLGRHTRQMQQNGASSRDSTTEAHRSAIKIILSFFFLFLLYFLAFIITAFRHFLPEAWMIKMVAGTITMFYPTGHSFILILANNKLKKTLVQILCRDSSYLKS
ncbi:taste receptor type 2 member 3-like [Erinaceus europaeus]|uniref:Taste receptor type 2 n=1 Tax=Erinaceus europaeus TaxID=9365 RepID=A0ABM3XSF0_ERIEU|nr:taste receptor type 2 member 3-like [Erinaceus europaeus]